MPSLSRRQMLGAMLLAAAGCESLRTSEMFNLRSQSPDSEDDDLEDELTTRVETPLVGDYVRPAGLNLIALRGVGLVTGLSGTGGDPPPSENRTLLLAEMRRRGIKNPNQKLADPNNALVIVQAYVPPLVQKGDRFDVEVRLEGGEGNESLAGGWLLETFLTEHAVVPGQGILQGQLYAKAQGPILIAPQEGESSAAMLRRGKILGGAVSLKERDFQLYLRNDFRSVRNAYRIAEKIGERFFGYNASGIREPLAEAKSDARIDLKIQPRYKDNYNRYVQAIRHIAFRENDIARRVRMQKLKEELNTPKTSEIAALKLEAIGPEAIPILKTGLENPSIEVRFHAATALAYLEEPAGLKHLAEAARKEPAFRVFALAAMAAIEDAEAHVLLREMMSSDPATYGDSAETRYGAFRALTTLDPNDPFVRGEWLPEADPEKRQFNFHVLRTEGPPMVHLCNHRKAEVVLFGADQKFRLPIAVRAGSHILVTGTQGSEAVTVSRHDAVDYKGRKEVASQSETVSTRIEDVIRAAASLGATYPDVVQMLVQADRQHNLPGRLEIDALPRSGRLYVRDKNEKDESRVGRPDLVPNIFDREPNAQPSDGAPSAEDEGVSESLVDASSQADEVPIELIEGSKWWDVRRFFRQADQTDAVEESQ